MRAYVDRFKSMVEELGEYPFIEVVTFDVNPPATRDDLSEVEQVIGASLAKPIRDFYGQANGLKLRWRIKLNVSPDEARRLKARSADYQIEIAESNNYPLANINIIPLQDSIVRRDWEELDDGAVHGDVSWGGARYPYGELRRRIKPFDLFSLYYCMAFYAEGGNGNPKVLLLSDYYSNWNDSRLTDFESYLEFLLATRGIVDSRERIYGEHNGITEPPLVTGPDYWTAERSPQLFKYKHL